MSKAYDDSRYLARTLAATMLDLEPAQRDEILLFLQKQVERLAQSAGPAETESPEIEDAAFVRQPDNDEGKLADFRWLEA